MGTARPDGTVVAWDGHVTNLARLRHEVALEPSVRYGGEAALLAGLSRALRGSVANRLRGSFALVCWSGASRTLRLSRDPAGIKRLVWARTSDYLLFASEAKALLASGLIEARLDPSAIDDLFHCWFPFPPKTMFAGISELPPAHTLEIHAGRVEGVSRYYRAPFPRRGEIAYRRGRELEYELIERLRASVRECLDSCGQTAVYLSGGLDSALIAALAAETDGRRLITLSVGNAETDLDESNAAARVSKSLGAERLVMRFQDHAADRFADAVVGGELPPIAPTFGSAWAASAMLRDRGISTVLTGDGADELLGGHEWHRNERIRSAFDRPALAWAWPRALRLAAGSAAGEGGIAGFLLDVFDEPGAQIAGRFGGLVPPQYATWQVLNVRRAELLGRDRPVSSTLCPPHDYLAALRPDLDRMHRLDAALSLEFESKLPSFNLLYVDRGAAAHGVDARTPFLDRDVIDTFARLPPGRKLGLRDKVGLRRAARGRVPRAIRMRGKRTPPRQFSLDLFSSAAPEWVRSLLEPAALETAGVFAAPVVVELLAERERLPAASFQRFRVESVLTLVAGVQLLHRHFIAGRERDHARDADGWSRSVEPVEVEPVEARVG